MSRWRTAWVTSFRRNSLRKSAGRWNPAKYQSEDDLVIDALDALEQEKGFLKAKIAKGVEEADRGPATRLGLEAFLKRMHERHAAANVIPSHDDPHSEIAERWTEFETDEGEPLDVNAVIARLEARLSS